MVTVKKVAKNASIYGTVMILQGAIGFFLLPIYTKYLTPNDYGIVSIVTAVTGFLGIFYLFGLHGAVSRYYYDYIEDDTLFKKFVGSILMTILIISLSLTTLLFLTHKFILDKFIKGINFYPYMALCLVTIALSTLFPIYQGILQMQHKAEKFAAQQFILFLLSLGLNITFIVIFKLGAMGPLLSALIVSSLGFIYAFISFNKFVSWNIDKKIIIRSLKYSAPLVPHTLAGWTSNLADRIILNNLKNTSLVGIYNIGYQFGNIIGIMTVAVNSAFVPWFFSVMKNDNNNRSNIYKFANAFVLLYSLGALWLSILSPYILKLMVNKNFFGAVDCIQYIAFAYVFNGVYYFFVSGLFYNEKGTKYIFICSTIAAIINIILNFVLIPKYNIVGASVATLISFAVMSVLVLCLSIIVNKKDNLKWRYKTMYCIVIVSMIITVILKKMKFNLMSNICLLLISTCILYLISGFKLKEIRNVINIKNNKV